MLIFQKNLNLNAITVFIELKMNRDQISMIKGSSSRDSRELRKNKRFSKSRDLGSNGTENRRHCHNYLRMIYIFERITQMGLVGV